ncbi:MAG: ABC transporter permease [Candidatus Gastranaerophilales bacterium]|nr:ABC transporter permease [Candidatus Gastranaerophilales bacterium]
MQLSPIVKKDVKVQSRSMKICWGLFVYEVILALVFFLAMLVIQSEGRYSTDNIYSSLVWLYPVLAITQFVILAMVVPVRAASSISGERERQTFDIMMTTSMTPFSIIMGKVMTAILQSMFYVAASMPIMALSFVIGGMSWSYLLWFFGIALLLSFLSASIGILCSAICKKSISAVILSYIFYLFFFAATFLPYIFYLILDSFPMSYQANGLLDVYGENSILFLLLNPIMYLIEFFGRIMAGESLVNSIPGSRTVGPIRFVASGYWWMIFSTILFLTVSFLFLWIAAKKIDPIKRRGKKQAAKRMAVRK